MARKLFVSIGEALGIVSKPMANTGLVTTNLSNDDVYTIHPENWFTAKPYGFRRTLRGQNSSTIFFLPIKPSNLTITTHFATNIISTLYGTVEEHSEIRYHDIVIEGTTGMAPQYFQEATDVTAATAETNKSLGRLSFPVNTDLSLGGFFSQTLGVVNQLLNKASDVIDGSDKTNNTGLFIDRTGYVAFHNLVKFLAVYKKDAAGIPTTNGALTSDAIRTKHPLTFFNYKDGNEYDVVVNNFILRRTAENPMLYYYQITMRGYNLRTVEASSQLPDDLTQRVKDLGLSGVDSSSILGDIKSISNDTKQIVGATIGGTNILGR